MTKLLWVTLLLALVAGCARQPRRTGGSAAVEGTGMASWYGGKFHGRLTANGERYNKEAMTAAHRRLKFGTCVRVRNLGNGREVQVRINDRGPYAKGRLIDVSEAAARKLGFIEQGVAKVQLLPCD